ncbi:MAG TPA: polymer-forming cytoskeletal protein [Pyrinomonadaceae bacterium]|nr:polymer-forming cytoskeletal protein [Pyrinomonadaceae bacterium]
MIRMGKGSKSEQPDVNEYHTSNSPSSSAPQYGSDAPQAVPRAVSDSESIARDIKEGRLSGFVGHGTTLTGETNFQMLLRVDGHLTGTVTSDGGTLIVGTNGQVDANVSVSIATINGNVNGDIIATEKIQLGRTAKVVGNIAAPRLVIEDGAILEGSCAMTKAREAQDKQVNATQEKQRSSSYSSSPSSYGSSSSSTSTSSSTKSTTDDFLGSSDVKEEKEAAVA